MDGCKCGRITSLPIFEQELHYVVWYFLSLFSQRKTPGTEDFTYVVYIYKIINLFLLECGMYQKIWQSSHTLFSLSPPSVYFQLLLIKTSRESASLRKPFNHFSAFKVLLYKTVRKLNFKSISLERTFPFYSQFLLTDKGSWKPWEPWP